MTASGNKIDPGKPEERNIYQAMEAGKQVKKLPMTLGDALEALKNDEVIKCGDAGRDASPLRRIQARRMGALPPHRRPSGT